MWRGYTVPGSPCGPFPPAAVALISPASPEPLPPPTCLGVLVPEAAGGGLSYGPDESFPPPPSPSALHQDTRLAAVGDWQTNVSTPLSLTPTGYCYSNRSSSTSVDSGRGSTLAAGSDNIRGPCPLASHHQHPPPQCRGGPHPPESPSLGGSLEQLSDQDHSQLVGSGGAAAGDPLVSVRELRLRGATDLEIIQIWLADLQLEQYADLFIQAGYDLATMTRMTPEDLNGIGVTNPLHRKRLKVEISKISVPDQLPDFIPESVSEWLQLLGLEEHGSRLALHQYLTLSRVAQISWEDLEEIGVKKLGHQKKMTLAIERLCRLQKVGVGSTASTVQSTSPSSPASVASGDQSTGGAVLSKIPRAMANTTATTGHSGSHGNTSTLAGCQRRGGQSTGVGGQLQQDQGSKSLAWSIHHLRDMPPLPTPLRHTRSASLGPATPSPNPTSTSPTTAGTPSQRPIGRVTAASSLERRRQCPPPPPKRITSIRPNTSPVTSPTIARRPPQGGGGATRHIHTPPGGLGKGSNGNTNRRNAYENCPEILPPSYRLDRIQETPPHHQRTAKPVQYVIGQPQQQKQQQQQQRQMKREERSGSLGDDEVLCSGSSRSRSSSAQSLDSANSIPFANENCGTIRHRSPPPAKPSLNFAFVGAGAGPGGCERQGEEEGEWGEGGEVEACEWRRQDSMEAGSQLRGFSAPPVANSAAGSGAGVRKTLPLHLPYDTGTRKRNPSHEPVPQWIGVRAPPVPTRKESISNAQANAAERVQLPRLDPDNCSTGGEFDDICDMLEDLTELLDREIHHHDDDYFVGVGGDVRSSQTNGKATASPVKSRIPSSTNRMT